MTEGKGIWSTRKEILGWIFDGVQHTMELLLQKLQVILHWLNKTVWAQCITQKDLEKLIGKLQHAFLALPVGHSILALAYQYTKVGANQPQPRRTIYLAKHPLLLGVLVDAWTLLRQFCTRPMELMELVPNLPNFAGYVDASCTGMGGVWLSHNWHLRPVVWWIQWPPDIQACMRTWDTPQGNLHINLFECASLLVHYIVLEQITNLSHSHIATWCDNKSTVQWICCMSAQKLRTAQ